MALQPPKMEIRRLAAVAAAGPLALLAGACGDGGSGAEGEVAAVAGIYPLAWVAERVAPDAEISSLSTGGLEAHDLELTPGQRAAIGSADVVLFVGDIAYQPQFEQAVASAEGQVVSMADVAGPERLLEPGEDAAAHGDEDAHGDEAAGSDEDAHGDEATGAVDPHIWFDIEVMADVARATGEAFAAADPGNAAAYRSNAAELGDELTELRGDLDAMLGGDCRHDEAIVSHQAYRYLLEPYGHSQHGVGGIDPEAGASSGELADLVGEIERDGIGHVLAEPVEGRRDAETVAAEAGVELLEVSLLDAVTDEQAATGFVELVRHQAAQFARALGC